MAVLLVPVQVQALVVNASVRQQGFRRWTMDYGALAAFRAPEPAAFSGEDAGWAGDPANDGVYLQWTLPSALRHGDHDPAGGTSFQPVPNRWLVVRTAGPAPDSPPSGRSITAWVVESDYLGADGTVPFLDPHASTPTPTRLGRVRPLAGWTEAAAGPLFLTALGPGNIAFSAFQPHAANVFSFHDPAAGLAGGDPLSYLVAGWYSAPSGDVLASQKAAGGFAALLAKLGWSVTGNETATTSVYHGSVTGVGWSPTVTGVRPAATRLAVGNTAVDALTALVRRQAAEQPEPGLDADLLEAFNHDLLGTLDDTDGPGLLAARIHDAWFGSRPGGSVWQVVAVPPATSGQAVAQEAAPPAAPPWLAGLNQAQATYDQAVRELAALQRELYEMWWKRGNAEALPTYPAGLSDAAFASALNPARSGGIAARVAAASAAVNAAREAIPWGATQDDLNSAIKIYTTAHPLPPGTELKRSDLPPFRMATDPVVVVAGARAGAFDDDLGTDASGLLPGRLADQIVTGLTVTAPVPASGPAPPGPGPAQPAPAGSQRTAEVTAATLAGHLPNLDLAHVPAVPGALLTEFLLLDPANAAAIAQGAFGTADPGTLTATRDAITAAMSAGTGVTGTPSAIPPQAWSQPWAPLFLEWEAAYYPVPFTGPAAGGAPSTAGSTWTFDGTDYAWTSGSAATADPLILGGRIVLTPQPSFTFAWRLSRYLAGNPDVSLAEVESFIAQIDGWDLLSQSLAGFGEQLAARDPAGSRAPDRTAVVIPPTTTMADLIGSGAVAAPRPGAPAPVSGVWPSSGFQPLRAGQFAFRRVCVVDRFGQSVDVVSAGSADAFAPVIADGLAPQALYALPGPTPRFVQVPPRLLQPARLDAGFVSATGDTVALPPDSAASPVCAWIIPNHLDAALACYGPDGTALGEACVTAGTAGPQVTWRQAPAGAYPTFDALTPGFPRLAEFLLGVKAAGPGAFADLLATIDETLWSIDPPATGDEQYLAVLVGRPLALVRAALRLEFGGPVVRDPAWPSTFSPAPAEVLGYTFPVRLGDLGLSGDGLIGYLAGPDTSPFYAVTRPAGATTSYVASIGPGAFPLLRPSAPDAPPQPPTYLTLLVDPQAPVHMVTGILPMTTLSVPARFTAAALESMAVTISSGPLLADFQVSAADADSAVVLTRPAELSGTWSWIETNGRATTTYGIIPADTAARFPGTAASLRSGWLQLSGALEPDEDEVEQAEGHG